MAMNYLGPPYLICVGKLMKSQQKSVVSGEMGSSPTGIAPNLRVSGNRTAWLNEGALQWS